MKKKRYSVETIVTVLKQADQGTPVTEITRKLASLSRLTTVGRRPTQGLCLTKFANSSSSKRKMLASSGSSPN